MADPNVFSPNRWDVEFPEFGLKGLRVGAHAGARELGASVYELAPGGAVSPYHDHLANEELLVVLAGTPSIRTPEGVRELVPGAVVSFLPGPAGAHRVLNASAEPATVLVLSTNRYPEVARHGDTGATVLLFGDGSGELFPPGSAADTLEWMRRAMAEGAQADSSQ